LDPLFEMYQLSDLEEDDEEELVVPSVRHPTHTYNTLTNSTVLHPDTTFSTNSYGGTQMSSGVPSRMSTRPHSRMTSRAGSFTDLPGMFADSNFSNIGLSKLLNEKNLSGARRSQLNLTAMSSISSLTPSVLTSPNASKNISPTGTPLHTPEEKLPGSTKQSSKTGFVNSLFSSLKAAIYGEQRKQLRSSKIFNDKEGSPALSDFDALYLGGQDDYDELEDISPGLLTLPKCTELPSDSSKDLIGQLNDSTGCAFLSKRDLGINQVSGQNHKFIIDHNHCKMEVKDQECILSGQNGPDQVSGLGVPCQPGTGARKKGKRFTRNDLGTVPGIQNKEHKDKFFRENHEVSSSFIGSVTNLLFGRKGGY